MAEALASWIALPIVTLVLALGLALTLERITGHRLGALRVPVGMCIAICLSLAVYWLHGTGWMALSVLGLLAAAGLLLERAQLRGWRPGWMSMAWLAAYLLYLAPVVLSGDWAWAGYNFVNDTAVQLQLSDYLAEHGMAFTPAQEPDTANQYLRAYFSTAYPLGAHSPLATLAEVVRVPVGALYQPYIAVLAATAAVALGDLARRAGLAAPAAAAAGALAVGANLLYQYALQGNVKEVAFFMAFAAAAAAGRELIASERPLLSVAAVAICFAAAFDVYSAASAPYLLSLGAVLAVAALWKGTQVSLGRLVLAGVALLVGSLVVAIPALDGAITFNDVASSTFAGGGPVNDLGHLTRPLELIQAAGVWLTGDYRLPVPTGREGITAVMMIVVGALLVVSVGGALRRREPAALLLLLATSISAVYLLPRLSPYADGKVLALASPVIVLGAAIGAWEFARWTTRMQPVAAVLAAVVALGVLWSDAFAYHVVKLSPVDRLEALDEIGHGVADVRGHGLVMLNEPEEYAKVFNGGAPYNATTEAITGRWVELREPRGFNNLYFDLDEQTLASVESYPAIVKRRSPDASRPPANYRLAEANDWYEAWIRQETPAIIDHMPLQGVKRATGTPNCRDLLALAARAKQDDVLVAAARPDEIRLDPLQTPRPAGWPPHPWQPGMVVPLTPGLVSGRVRSPRAGRYRVWVAGGTSRPIEIRVDGRRVGAAVGVNNVGQWLPAGEVELDTGPHRVGIARGGGNLKPGDGYIGELGPVVLEPIETSPTLKRVEPANAGRLCGRPWDWIELVRYA